VIPHGFEAPEAQSLQKQSAADRPLQMVFTGDFYGIRSPKAFLEALIILNNEYPLEGRLQVNFVGYVKRRIEYKRILREAGLHEVVSFTGSVPYLDAQKAAGDADILLLIDAPGKTSVFLPSKLVDYLAFGKPILGLTPENGTSADLLQKLECPVVSPDRPGEVAAALEGMLEQWEAGTLSVSPAFQRIAAAYDVRVTTDALEDVLARAVQDVP
jgi:glycosyltransferase involved in cell wall biosynthesis